MMVKLGIGLKSQPPIGEIVDSRWGSVKPGMPLSKLSWLAPGSRLNVSEPVKLPPREVEIPLWYNHLSYSDPLAIPYINRVTQSESGVYGSVFSSLLLELGHLVNEDKSPSFSSLERQLKYSAVEQHAKFVELVVPDPYPDMFPGCNLRKTLKLARSGDCDSMNHLSSMYFICVMGFLAGQLGHLSISRRLRLVPCMKRKKKPLPPKQEFPALNDAPKVKKWKKKTKSDIVNSGIMEAQAKADGILDTAKQRLMDVEQNEKDKVAAMNYEWVANPWALSMNYNTRSFTFVAEDDEAYIDAIFNIGGVKKLFVGTFNYYYGQKVYESTDCRTMYKISRNDVDFPNRRPDILDSNVPFGNPTDRVWVSVKGVLNFLDFRMRVGDTAMLAKIRGHYLKSYPYYDALDADILSILENRISDADGKFYTELYHKRIRRSADLYVRYLEARIDAVLCQRGETAKGHYEMKYKKYHQMCLSAAACSVPIRYGLDLDKIPAVMLTSSVASYIYLHWDYWFDKHNSYVKFMENLHKNVFPLQEYSKYSPMVPACKVYIKSCVVCDLPTVKQADDVELKVDYVEKGIVDERPVVESYGTIIDKAPVAYPDWTDPKNFHAGILSRMAVERPTDDNIVQDFISKAKLFIDSMPTFDLSDMTDEDDLCYLYGNYGAKKGAELAKLYDEPYTKADRNYSGFVKREPYVGKTPDDMKTRPICSCPPKVIAKHAARFNKLGKLFGKYMKDNGLMYASGVDPSTIGRYACWASAIFPFIYESDVKSWDGSVQKFMLELEKYFLENKVVGLGKDFEFILKSWCDFNLANRDRSVSLEMEHGRKSGDLWTSVFNSFLNLLISMYCYGIETKDFMAKMWAFLVLGDDNVVMKNKPVDVDKVVATYAALGMECKLVFRESLEDTEFCSGRFWDVDGHVKWGNLPLRLISKLGLNNTGQSPKIYRQLLYGTAKSLLSTGGHVPIVGALLRAIIDSAEDQGMTAKKTSDYTAYKIQGGMVDYPGFDTYEQFAKLYHVDLDAIFQLEEWIECNVSIMKMPYVCKDPIFLDGFKIDVAGDTEYDSFCVDYPEAYDNIVYYKPLEEEKEKLQGVNDYWTAVKAGYRWGVEEDEDSGTTDHAFMHALFSALSFNWLNIGVGMHSAYNNLAVTFGLVPCTKKRVAKRVTKSKKKKERGLGRNLLESGLGAVGGLLGPMGASFGKNLGAGLSKVFGMGDYQIVPEVNSLVHGGADIGAATFKGDDHMIISHREPLLIVSSSTTFTTTTFSMNPAIPQTCPWGSRIAPNFQQWEPLGIMFEFNSTYGEFISGTAPLGVVVMAYQYDANDIVFTDRLSMENSMYARSCKPSCNFYHAVECKPGMSPYQIHYTRRSQSIINDANEYDWGKFTIAVDGMISTGDPIGELWITYHFKLLKPILTTEVGLPALFGRYAAQLSTGGWGTALGFGGTLAPFMSFSSPTVLSISLPPITCEWMLILMATGTISGTVSLSVGGDWAHPSGTFWGIEADTSNGADTAGSGGLMAIDFLVSSGLGTGTLSIPDTYEATFLDLYIWQGPSASAYPVALPLLIDYVKRRADHRDHLRLMALLEEKEAEEEPLKLSRLNLGVVSPATVYSAPGRSKRITTMYR